MQFRAVVMKFVGRQLFFVGGGGGVWPESWAGAGRDTGECLRLQTLTWKRQRRKVHERTCSRISRSASHKRRSSLFGELRSAFTRSFYSYQLLVMVIKYIPSARHQLLGSGAPRRGLAGRWGGGLPACLAGWLAGWLGSAVALLAAMCKTE